MNEELLTDIDVAKLLHVSTALVRRWRLKKTGPRWRRIGGTLVRYSAQDLRTWIQEQPTGGAPVEREQTT
jgi:predicted DNA-binding transcriptional regulator AlpA